MEDRLLVDALRRRDPGGVAAVFDTYADRLYAYCWFRLRNQDAAGLALRDTLMCAEAHIRELRSTTRFGPWLYALARVQCGYRRPPSPVPPDVPIARHDQDDVDLRVLAWRAVAALPPLSQELLDLRHRHDLALDDVANVVALPGRELAELLTQARVLLEAALIAEILAHDDAFACPRRTEILRGRTGDIDDDLREALFRHSLECTHCVAGLPRGISPVKVCELLPRVVPDSSLRAEILHCFTDAERAGYRLFAAAQMSRFGPQGFPVQTDAVRRAAARRRIGRWPRAAAALAGALLATVAAAAMCRWFGPDDPGGPHGLTLGQLHSGAPLPSPAPPALPEVARPVSATLPVTAPQPTVAAGGSLPHGLPSAPGAGRLTVTPPRLALTPGGSGAITLRATDGAVAWQASGGAAMTFAPVAGTLDAGATETIVVTAPASRQGETVLAFHPGAAQVRVTWSGTSSPPPPSPTPTPTPPPGSGSPTPTRSPTPGSPSPPTPAPTTPAPAPTTSGARNSALPPNASAPTASAPNMSTGSTLAASGSSMSTATVSGPAAPAPATSGTKASGSAASTAAEPTRPASAPNPPKAPGAGESQPRTSQRRPEPSGS